MSVLTDIGRPEFLHTVLHELNLSAVEIHNIYPQNERAVRLYIVRKIRLAQWEQLARLLNSDTE